MQGHAHLNFTTLPLPLSRYLVQGKRPISIAPTIRACIIALSIPPFAMATASLRRPSLLGPPLASRVVRSLFEPAELLPLEIAPATTRKNLIPKIIIQHRCSCYSSSVSQIVHSYILSYLTHTPIKTSTGSPAPASGRADLASGGQSRCRYYTTAPSSCPPRGSLSASSGPASP